jgi:hypothetical protein
MSKVFVGYPRGRATVLSVQVSMKLKPKIRAPQKPNKVETPKTVYNRKEERLQLLYKLKRKYWDNEID